MNAVNAYYSAMLTRHQKKEVMLLNIQDKDRRILGEWVMLAGFAKDREMKIQLER